MVDSERSLWEQELEHSPDGKAYIVGHGASRPDSIQAWMLGDEVQTPLQTPQAIMTAIL